MKDLFSLSEDTALLKGNDFFRLFNFADSSMIEISREPIFMETKGLNNFAGI